jgi:iron complex outermembrane receptor protein
MPQEIAPQSGRKSRRPRLAASQFLAWSVLCVMCTSAQAERDSPAAMQPTLTPTSKPTEQSTDQSSPGPAESNTAPVQNAAPANAANAPVTPEGQVQEIVVTAQRREQHLQDVPISVQVIGGSTLTEQNLDSLTALMQIVPSVHVGSGTRSNDMYIRGIGSGNNESFDQSVGVFVDDIYHGRSRTTAGTFLDLERVEVLKGPQSTFFGNNAIAGAFNMVTRKPGGTFEAEARALYGQEGQYAVEAELGGPITDALGARLALISDGQRGWLTNLNTGHHVPAENNLAGRLTLVFKPSEDFDSAFKLEGSDNQNTGALAIQGTRCPPPAPFLSAGFCKTAIGLGLAGDMGLDKNISIQSGGQGIDLDTTEYVLTNNYRHWGHTFTAVTGYYDYTYLLNLDGDATPLDLANAQIPERYHQFSQELRVASSAQQRIEYLGGLYFQSDDLFIRQDQNLFFLSPTIRAALPFAPLVPFLPIGQRINFDQSERSYAAFGSATWNITDRFKLTGGLRGSWVTKPFDYSLLYGTASQNYGGIIPYSGTLNSLPVSATGLQGIASKVGLGPAGSTTGSRSDHAWLPSAKLQYQFSPDMMGYLSYAKGFKAGGFNGVDSSGNPANIPYAPEHVNAYELGLKSEWFARKVLVNLALFRSDYGDLQVTQTLPSGAGSVLSVVKNAAGSVSQGVELEAQWAVTKAFHLSGNIAYDDAYYVSYPNVPLTQLQTFCHRPANVSNHACVQAFGGDPGATQDLSGRPTSFAPLWTGSLTGDYRLHMGNSLLTTALTAIYSSSYFTNAGLDDPILAQASYLRLDGRLTLETPDRHWAVDLIGKNLTDRNIVTFALPWPNSLGSAVIAKEPPRNVAVQVRSRW